MQKVNMEKGFDLLRGMASDVAFPLFYCPVAGRDPRKVLLHFAGTGLHILSGISHEIRSGCHSGWHNAIRCTLWKQYPLRSGSVTVYRNNSKSLSVSGVMPQSPTYQRILCTAGI